jgi:hypothetical protein
LKRWLQAGGIKQTKFCNAELPVTKQMLPKLLVLLQHCHASGQKSNQLYFNLQKTIQNHYMTEGNCFFFGDSKEILSGELVKMKL